jgi:recombination protein RecR
LQSLPASAERLVAALQRMPTIGPKSAQRLAYHLMQCPPGQAEELADALLQMRRTVRNCSLCHNFTDNELCALCSDGSRDETTLCVVGHPRDVAAIERTREFRGRYHVLGGLINPLEGIGPDQVRTRELIDRLNREPIQELVLATDPTVAGEATALYLHRQLKDRFKITRLALGIPLGTDLEYADEVTLGRAFRHRQIL